MARPEAPCHPWLYVVMQGEAELGLAAELWAACAHHLRQQLPDSTRQGGEVEPWQFNLSGFFSAAATGCPVSIAQRIWGSAGLSVDTTQGQGNYAHLIGHHCAVSCGEVLCRDLTCRAVTCCAVLRPTGQLGCCSGPVPAAEEQPAGREAQHCDLQHPHVCLPHKGAAAERELTAAFQCRHRLLLTAGPPASWPDKLLLVGRQPARRPCTVAQERVQLKPQWWRPNNLLRCISRHAVALTLCRSRGCLMR